MKYRMYAFVGVGVVLIMLCIYAWSCIYTVRAGSLAVITYSNGESAIEDTPGFHMTTGDIQYMKIIVTRRAGTEPIDGTITTLQPIPDYNKPNSEDFYYGLLLFMLLVFTFS